MLIVRPAGWFSWDFEVYEEAGRLAGEVRLSAWRERGSVAIGGVEYRVTREGMLGAFVLEGPGGVAAQAEKPSAFSRAFALEYGGRQLTLKAAAVWSRRFVLGDAGATIGAVVPAGIFSRQARAELPEDNPPEVRLFVIWLSLMMWRRETRAARRQ